ncbi:MAG: nucleoside triphosphate pyrophosphohydrolase [Myxococcales bacterium]|nr:nucleoside triphosphate pyrophosphohydrolase [Myxococcales bacterium]
MRESSAGSTLPELVDVMKTLLGPEGCPWDKEQTLETLRTYVIEEAHEVVEAIDRGEPELLREELGDLLFQVVFQAELAAAKGWFAIDDVVRGIAHKMVRRHPWVFGDEAKGEGGAEALARWEAQKAEEKRAKGGKLRGALAGVPVALPALLRAFRVGEKAAAHGFDWPDVAGARGKVTEELAELDEAVAGGAKERIEEELGDLLFALASFGRKLGVDPEAALRRALDRFSKRFHQVEVSAHARGGSLRDFDDETLDAMWEDAKRVVG